MGSNPVVLKTILVVWASGVMAATSDLKSEALKSVSVRVRSSPPNF